MIITNEVHPVLNLAPNLFAWLRLRILDVEQMLDRPSNTFDIFEMK